jgi:ATP-dependent helicase/nuclease subunit A
MTDAMPATNPHFSASVSASAGTGKTWLLVTRLIRLLLTGERPDSILAVTFTRKAAAEMQVRLNERLLQMAQCSDYELVELLTQIGMKTDHTTLHQARTLYEQLLSSPHTVRTTTFHAFCQDILRKFPLEAGIAPGFELLEATADVTQAAWDALCAETSLDPDSKIALSLEKLFDTCGGLHNTMAAINSFLDHRSDWWAFTENQNDPLPFATGTLCSQLGVTLDDQAEQDFFTPSILETLTEFVSLLQKHPGKKNNEALEALSIARNATQSYPVRFQHTVSAFLTKNGKPLARKESGTQAKNMGEAGQQRFLQIHHEVCAALEVTRNKISALQSLKRISAWYRAGNRVLQHYQRIKCELRVLDFSDLEWRAYRLLNHGDNVHWVQYKLDQRIDHLLVDEFQDTNPTQWRLILPLLQELAAGEDERGRSVFLVGDTKQSIYRFRRAEPELFDTAQQWLQNNLRAKTQQLNVSWRSAKAIMDFVNQVFGDGPLNRQLMHFSKHSTHHADLYGHVEVFPLIENQNEKQEREIIPDSSTGLRNPLRTPREDIQDERHLNEGRLIANRIQDLVNNNFLIEKGNEVRPVEYSDIIILLRKRTHAADYEQALREAGVPYAGTDRGTLLESLETRDLINLLELLIAPFNNLALANILRSPIFDCDHADLIELAKLKQGSWMERLSLLASSKNDNNSQTTEKIGRAYKLLSQWHNLAGRIPVHDLLDRIYCDADIINRYHAAYPFHLRQRVVANLTRFIELALEIDSGRHPTIGRFVARLHLLKQQDKEAPDEGTPIQAGTRVRFMTIHGSKGLEAPIIFLADAANPGSDKKAYQAVIDWPAQSERPNAFLLPGKKDLLDTFTTTILEQHAQAEKREDANLLYVALTRARQLLFVSGCRPNKGKDLGWYGLIMDQVSNPDEPIVNESIVLESGKYPEKVIKGLHVIEEPIVDDQRLAKPIPPLATDYIIAPSHQTGTPEQFFTPHETEESGYLLEDGRSRGIAIHRVLQILCDTNGEESDTTLARQLSCELEIKEGEQEIQTWINEARLAFNKAELAQIFNSNNYNSTYSEVPIQYPLQKDTVYGIIDRLVVTDTEIWVIDYKTHQWTTETEKKNISEYYRPQVALYCQGVKNLWPDKRIRGFLLFTHHQTLVELQELA